MVGSNVVRRLLANRSIERVVVVDNFSSGKREHLEPFVTDPRLEVVYGDLEEDPDWMLHVKANRGPLDTVIHLVANPDISKAVDDPGIDFRQGTVPMNNLLEVMRESEIKNLLYLSGSGVYGEHRGDLVPFTEDYGPCIPISTYAASKLACEAMIAAHCHMFGLRARVLRPANIVGPNQTHGVSYDFLHQLLDHPTHLRILGDGRQSKSYIYVDDLIDALFQAEAGGLAASYVVYNVASFSAITVNDVAAIALEVCGLNPSRVTITHTEGIRGWRGDVPIIRLDCQRLLALGWAPHGNSYAAVPKGLLDLSGQATHSSRPSS